MLGLEPTGDHLIVDPLLPDGIGQIELLDIPGRWGHIDAFCSPTMTTPRKSTRWRGILAKCSRRRHAFLTTWTTPSSTRTVPSTAEG